MGGACVRQAEEWRVAKLGGRVGADLVGGGSHVGLVDQDPLVNLLILEHSDKPVQNPNLVSSIATSLACSACVRLTCA